MECKYHEKREATSTCVECKTPICNDCSFVIGGKSYCKKCAKIYLEEIDKEMLVDIPDRVVCKVCGEVKGIGEEYSVCSPCGKVVCPSHYTQLDVDLCFDCYEKYIEEQIQEARKEHKIWICGNCSAENLLTFDKCRKCGKPSPEYQKVLDKREQQRKQQNRKIFIGGGIFAGIFLEVCLIAFIVGQCAENNAKSLKYQSAENDIQAGKYDDALQKLQDLGTFKDSSNKVEEVKKLAYENEMRLAKDAFDNEIKLAQDNENDGNLETALSHFEKANEYGDAENDISRISLIIANQLYTKKDYENAVTYFVKSKKINPLSESDLENYNYSLAYFDYKAGLDLLKNAEKESSGFIYSKAISDDNEYVKLKSIVDDINSSIACFEEAKVTYPDLPDLSNSLALAKDRLASLKTKLANLEKDRAAEKERLALKKAAEERYYYGKLLREWYLDNGMDVDVYVYGPENKYIKLSYVLFGDVSVHMFQKGDQIIEMKDAGFEKVVMTDGYYESWTIPLK